MQDVKKENRQALLHIPKSRMRSKNRQGQIKTK